VAPKTKIPDLGVPEATEAVPKILEPANEVGKFLFCSVGTPPNVIVSVLIIS
jgi:hypothetical protein